MPRGRCAGRAMPSMKLLGERLLDMPWLYGAVPRVV